MRPTTLQRVTPRAPSLVFDGSLGEKFQISILEQDLIRVQMHPEGYPRLDRTWMVAGANGTTPREGHKRDDLTRFQQPPYARKQSSTTIEIETGQLRLIVHYDDLRLEWFDQRGERFAADLLGRAYTYDRTGRRVYHYMERREDEYYYGFGERAGTLDKRGMRLRMMNVDALGYNAEHSDPLYKHFPFYITYIPPLNTAYGLFYDNLATTVFDLGKEIDAFWGHYRYWAAEDGDVDYTLVYGPTIEAVVEKFAALIGRPALPPRWSLGYLGSTMSYTEAPDSQEQLRKFVQLCDKHEIPCDMFHLSSGYTTDDAGTRCVFTWNRSRIPDPAQMVQTFHDAGIRVAANIKPYLVTHHPYFEQVRQAGGFIHADSEPALCRFWSGGAFQSALGAYVDFSSPAGFDWWKRQIRDALLAYGIDAAWNDNNEYEVWDDEATCDGFGKPIPMALMRPVQTLLMAQASYEALCEERPNLRPFILSRSGCPGIQRYAQTWSGDNATSWHSLRYNIPMGLGMGLSGAPNTGHDIGGFYGPAPDAELLVRWVQNGVFHPRFTIHSWNTDGSVNEPWMYPEVLPFIREAIQLRYRLLPYLYSLFFEAHQTGHPIIRPMVYHFPNDPRCHTESFDFLLGPTLLVASVLEPGARTRDVYLPQGTWWCDYYSGEWHEGGQTVTADAPLHRIPLFVRDGGLLPMGKPMRYVGATPDDQRTVYAFVHDVEGASLLVEDDGVTNAYRQGTVTKIRLTVHLTNGRLVAQAHRELDGYDVAYDRIDFIIATPPELTVEGGSQHDGRWHLSVPLR